MSKIKPLSRKNKKKKFIYLFSFLFVLFFISLNPKLQFLAQWHSYHLIKQNLSKDQIYYNDVAIIKALQKPKDGFPHWFKNSPIPIEIKSNLKYYLEVTLDFWPNNPYFTTVLVQYHFIDKKTQNLILEKSYTLYVFSLLSLFKKN